MSIFLGDQEFQGAYLGTNRLQFVYLGEDIVWQDNAAPVVSNATFNGVPLAQNSELSILRNTAHTITFNVSDLEGDAPYTAKLLRNDTQVGDSVPNIPEGGSVTFTIPASEYGGASDVGAIDDNWDINVEDSVGSEDDFEFKVTTLDFTAPTTGLNRSGTVIGSAATLSYSWNAQNTVSGQDQTLTTTIDGNSVANSGSDTVSATCGGSTDLTLVSTTTGGGITKNTTSTFTYSRTASNTTTSCGGYSGCTANAPTKCNSTLMTCTDTGTERRTCVTRGIRICDGAQLSENTFTQSRSCSDSNTNTGFVGDVTISGPSSFNSDATGTYVASLPSLGGGVTVSDYNWTVNGGTIDSGQGTGTIVVSGSPGSGDVTLVVTFANVSEGTTTRTSNEIEFTIIDNTFTCAVAMVDVPDGTVGLPTTATAAVGSTVGVTPTTYQLGTNTYNVGVRAPAGYSNAGAIITCTDTAVGSVNNFDCDDANYTVAENRAVNSTVSATVSAGTLLVNSPGFYQGGEATYTGTIQAPSGFSNSGENITCTDTATSLFTIQSMSAQVNPELIFGFVGSSVFQNISINWSGGDSSNRDHYTTSTTCSGAAVQGGSITAKTNDIFPGTTLGLAFVGNLGSGIDGATGTCTFTATGNDTGHTTSTSWNIRVQ